MASMQRDTKKKMHFSKTEKWDKAWWQFSLAIREHVRISVCNVMYLSPVGICSYMGVNGLFFTFIQNRQN